VISLWQAMHVKVDPPPHVLEDEIGLQLVAPDDGWRDRPDMDPRATRGFRAAIVARARFMKDLVTEQAGHGVTQYVILGAGLDTFAQRRPEIASRLRVFEVDQPGPQAWKRRRLIEDEMLAQARAAGFKDARHVSGTLLAERYFAARSDGLRPSSGEDLLVATT
jgi:methyltransferase (TIGR00027 family)